jgi:hypothetical protein
MRLKADAKRLVRATLLAGIEEAQRTPLAGWGIALDDTTPLRFTRALQSIGLTGEEVFSHESRSKACEIAALLNARYIAAGRSCRAVVRLATIWRIERAQALQELVEIIDAH